MTTVLGQEDQILHDGVDDFGGYFVFGDCESNDCKDHFKKFLEMSDTF